MAVNSKGSVMPLWQHLQHALPRLSGSCPLCERAAARHSLCPGCHVDLPWNRDACRSCALPVPAGQPYCGACRQTPPRQWRCVAPLRYEFPVDHLVAGLKYHRRLDHAPVLGRLLAAAQPAAGPCPELLLPVPLHPRRLAERGYNQALEVARPLARALGLPLETRLLHRTRATAAQMTLDAATRARNPKGAFALDARRLAALGKPRRIALVDDVMTTGATLDAIACLLQRAGVAHIEYWVVARTP